MPRERSEGTEEAQPPGEPTWKSGAEDKGTEEPERRA